MLKLPEYVTRHKSRNSVSVSMPNHVLPITTDRSMPVMLVLLSKSQQACSIRWNLADPGIYTDLDIGDDEVERPRDFVIDTRKGNSVVGPTRLWRRVQAVAWAPHSSSLLLTVSAGSRGSTRYRCYIPSNSTGYLFTHTI